MKRKILSILCSILLMIAMSVVAGCGDGGSASGGAGISGSGK